MSWANHPSLLRSIGRIVETLAGVCLSSILLSYWRIACPVSGGFCNLQEWSCGLGIANYDIEKSSGLQWLSRRVGYSESTLDSDKYRSPPFYNIPGKNLERTRSPLSILAATGSRKRGQQQRESAWRIRRQEGIPELAVLEVSVQPYNPAYLVM